MDTLLIAASQIDIGESLLDQARLSQSVTKHN